MNSLAKFLKESHVRQGDLAQKLGISQASVSRLASGTLRPSLTVAVKLEIETGGAVTAASWLPAERTTDAA